MDSVNYYGSLCTEMYELLHSQAPQDELAFYLSYAHPGDRVLELLCGSGRFLVPFVQKGFDITGVDLSQEMLEKLLQKYPAAKVHRCSADAFESEERFDYIFISSGSVSLFTDPALMSALGTTLSIGILAAVISTILGTVGAIALFQMKRGPRHMLMSIVNLPMLNSEVVTGVSLMLLYAMAHVQLGYITLLLSHVGFCVPYVVLSVMPKLRQLDPHLAEAAQDLGATPFQGFMRVILPDIMPGMFSGFIMALTMSIDDFVVSFFTTGSGVSNLSITIYTMAKRGISPKINALSTLMLAAIFVIVGLSQLLRARSDRNLYASR